MSYYIALAMTVCMYLGSFAAETLLPVEKSGRMGFVDAQGRLRIPLRYNYVIGFSGNGLSQAGLDGKHGWIDYSGTEVIPLQYEDAWDFREGLAAVRVGSRWHYIDVYGRRAFPKDFAKTYCFSGGLSSFMTENGKWGFIDRLGNIVIQPKWDEVRSFQEGLSAVTIDKKWGYINRRGELLIEMQFDYAWEFSGGVAVVCKKDIEGDKFGLINKSGKIVVDYRFKIFGCFREGLARASLDDKHYGFIDTNGEWVIQPDLKHADDFSEGLAAVCLANGKSAYIDRQGKVAIQLTGILGPFQDGTAKIEYKNRTGYIDKKGNWIVKPEYDPLPRM